MVEIVCVWGLGSILSLSKNMHIIIYSRFGSRLLAAPFPRSPPARGGLPVLARPRLGLGARGLRRGAHANSVVVVVVIVVVTARKMRAAILCARCAPRTPLRYRQAC